MTYLGILSPWVFNRNVNSILNNKLITIFHLFYCKINSILKYAAFQQTNLFNPLLLVVAKLKCCCLDICLLILILNYHVSHLKLVETDCKRRLVRLVDGLRPTASLRPPKPQLQHPLRPHARTIQGRNTIDVTILFDYYLETLKKLYIN